MIELPLVFLAGILGSAHCVGMCGGFAVLVGLGARDLVHNLLRQAVYGLGRVFTYVFLGVLCIHLGQRFTLLAPSARVASATLSLAAGGILAYQGMRVLLPGMARGTVAGGGACLAGSLFAGLLSTPGHTSALLAGVFTGLLPCGLVYGMLALAASTGSLARGSAMMLVFGLGTLPVMIATGCGGALLQLATRRRLYTIAGACVLAAGLISLARGAGQLFPVAASGVEAACPWCR